MHAYILFLDTNWNDESFSSPSNLSNYSFQVRPRTRAELEKERIEEEHKKQVAVDKMVARKREEGRYGRGGNYSGRPSTGAVGGPGGGSSRRSLLQDNASVPAQVIT